MNEQVFAELGQQMLTARDAGVTHIHVERLIAAAGDDPLLLIDSWVTRLGYKPLSTEWREVQRAEAARILQSILHRDLAYGAEIMPLQVAEELAGRFCELFSRAARYFTNGTWRAGQWLPASWNPLTDATFDAGILAVGESCMGMLWVEDED